MKIALLDVHYQNYKSIFEISGEIKKEYCDKHGYDFLVYHPDQLIPANRQKNWARIQGILYYLHNYDWLFYTDTDMLIMNHQIKLEDYIDDNYNLIVGPLPEEGHLMSSSMLIKNCRWAIEFFLDLYSQVQFIDNPYYSQGNFFASGKPCSGGYYFEQSALHFLYDTEEKYRSKIKVVPRNLFNSEIGTYRDGDFLIHFPGQYSKLSLMKKMLHEGYDAVIDRGTNFLNPTSEIKRNQNNYQKIKRSKIFTVKKT